MSGLTSSEVADAITAYCFRPDRTGMEKISHARQTLLRYEQVREQEIAVRAELAQVRMHRDGEWIRKTEARAQVARLRDWIQKTPCDCDPNRPPHVCMCGRDALLAETEPKETPAS